MIMKSGVKRTRQEEFGRSATLKVDEAAPLLGVHANTIRRWSQMGILEYLRIGSRGYRMVLQERFERRREQQTTENN